MRIKNRIAIYFPEYKDVYGDLNVVSERRVLKIAPLKLMGDTKRPQIRAV